ncbi:hypothetical protein AVEN_112172-1 [Araneus ventricosus]|uniref:Uncharacterized protein n=1 Tax=Araneus ventricosus TaxID=182803 RepID=A0A4Y2WTE6_ARAVE|nr:hypothetical protein AVEN_112172-1 [Araneus ventricosus]
MEGKFEQLLAFMKEMKQCQEEMKQGQEEMKQGQEELKQGQEELKQRQDKQVNILNVISTKPDTIVEKAEKNEKRLDNIVCYLGEEKFVAIEDKVDAIQQNFGKLEQKIYKLKKVEKIPEGFEDYWEQDSKHS